MTCRDGAILSCCLLDPFTGVDKPPKQRADKRHERREVERARPAEMRGDESGENQRGNERRRAPDAALCHAHSALANQVKEKPCVVNVVRVALAKIGEHQAPGRAAGEKLLPGRIAFWPWPCRCGKAGDLRCGVL